MSYALNEHRPSNEVLKGMLLTIPALYGVTAIFYSYYSQANILPFDGFIGFILKLLSLVILFHYTQWMFHYLRNRRVMKYKSAYRIYSSNLRLKAPSGSAVPNALEVITFICYGLVILAGFHIIRVGFASSLLLLLVPASVFYLFIETAKLNRWKAKEDKNV